MSLWQAESSVAQRLMESFYTHLQEGASKDEALSQARTDYLKHPFIGREHPRYWGNFVVIGEAGPIEKGKGMWVWITLAVLVFLLGFWRIRNVRL